MLNNFGQNGKNVEVYVLKIINNQLDIGSLEEKQDLTLRSGVIRVLHRVILE